MTSFFRKLRWLMRRPDKEAELQEALQFHLEEEAGERRAQGLAGEEARLEAAASWETSHWCRRTPRRVDLTVGEQLVQDVRYACAR
jgi:hypothetical protein